MEFLGKGFNAMFEQSGESAAIVGQFRQLLQRSRFRLQVRTHGIIEMWLAADDENYKFRRNNGTKGQFRLVKPLKRLTPPRIIAQGLNPVPTLVSFHDA